MTLIQVANPYMAYLDFGKFLAGNTGIQSGGYYWWDGDVEHGFSMVSANGNRYEMIGSPFTYSPPGLIAPLQSFIVAKAGGSTGNVPKLKMSPAWTTTSTGVYESYSLRTTRVLSGGILDIQASQGNKSSHAALLYDPEATLLLGKEDLPAAVVDEAPLTLYTFTPQRDALALNTSGDFESYEVALGLRVRDAGETKLTFTGLDTFGHEVYLIDYEKGTITILSETPEYTFTIAKSASSGFTELNDRFRLRFYYTGNGIVTGNEPLATLNAYAQDGYLYVRSREGEIAHLQIYTVLGGLVYDDRTPSHQYRIKLSPSIYIIKAFINNKYTNEKVIVK
jgi:hypothetical protein